ncbi:MAG: glycosyltransferase, partial [Planctomycetes bacterium]|nr:glycosyltransferase [Planctomycetota bacterium]
EVEEQYGLYDHYEPARMVVIPPGVDLRLFHPPGREKERPAIQDAIDRFLREPDKPMILAMARPDPRKNLAALIQAYAEDPALREKANLAIIAGNRDEIASMEKVSREVLTEILLLVDKYDLYGKVAYPKRHEPDDVPHIYRLAARRRGVFVNPALTEPFGLTLIEAAASGLPLVATNDGGPRDILAQLQCGVLVDALSVEEIRGALRRALEDPLQWKEWSRRGARYAPRLYGWKTHVANYLKAVEKNLGHRRRHRRFSPRSRLPTIDRMLICDIDNTLIGDRGALRDLLEVIRSTPALGFGVATGRHLELTLDVLDEWDVPVPDVLITSVGTEIHYGEKLARDGGWSRRIDYRWNPEAICDVLRGVPGLVLQPEEMQRRFKISYFCDPRKAPSIRSLARDLRHRDLPVKLVYSHGQFLDVLPVRASKGLAVRFFAMRWGLEPDHILVCGDSGNDVEMLSGETLGVVVGNYSKELERLRGRERIYFAGAPYARGILEGMEYYDFLGEIRAPEVVEFTA